MATETIIVKGQNLGDAVNAALSKFFSRLAAKLTLDVHANLVRAPGEGGTPVDTGWARANWQPRVRERPVLPIGTRPPSGSRFADPGVAAAAASEIATGYRIDMGDLFVSNVVPYIGQLNAGSSKQAPPGFVEAAIAKAVVEDSQR